ncbi:uncharacterized protein PV09_07234 [Verruconis gallopava]|uniref:Uncharacterized protein n=1 Tax=Verruconis gallopava TaxID=253628 RepID=A0A0D1XH03_9PEZI|nr:uncharacterized protein PV09_07234 [Verruconis gallopava]KIW01481.1 hypothetical protein PV09_07234 [Verruconis gallopava]
MHMLVPPGNRAIGSMDTQDRQTAFADSKTMPDPLGAVHNDTMTRPTFPHPSTDQQRLTSTNALSGLSGYGLNGGPDSKADDSQRTIPPVINPMSAFDVSASNATCSPAPTAAAESTTPSKRLLLPPPPPPLLEFHDVQPILASSSLNQKDSQAAADLGDFENSQSSGDGELLPHQSAETTGELSVAAVENSTSGTTIDEGRTITAPGTPVAEALGS